MKFPYNHVNNIPVIKIKESENLFSEVVVEDFFKEIIKLYTHSTEKIAFDLTEKEYFNSADLGVLVKIKDMLLDEGIDLVLINPSDRSRELLKMVGVFDLFMFVENEKELN